MNQAILSRRGLIIGGIVLAGASIGPKVIAKPARLMRTGEGTFTTTRAGNLAVHTYTAPDKGWQVTTQIVELSNELVLVDGQYLLPYAREAAAFCKSLGKPISRLYITHFHPDHHLGASAFDAPLYALPDVRKKIIAIGDRLAREESAKFPNEPGIIPATAVKPQNDVTPGTETIGGETFDFRVVRHAEADPSLAVVLPGRGIVIAQDLVYNKVHLFLGEKNFDGWISALTEYELLPYRHILPGHGLPGGKSLYREMIDYLSFARNALSKSDSGAAFEEAMIRRYPDYGGLALLEHERRFLFRTS